jgi:hypothetical protein
MSLFKLESGCYTLHSSCKRPNLVLRMSGRDIILPDKRKGVLKHSSSRQFSLRVLKASCKTSYLRLPHWIWSKGAAEVGGPAGDHPAGPVVQANVR